MSNYYIDKSTFEIGDLNIKNKIKTKDRIILNYSELKIFNIKTLKNEEIEKYIEREILNNYEDSLLDYVKDRRNKETIIYMYKNNSILNSLLKKNSKIKIYPMELFCIEKIKKEKKVSVKINEKVARMSIENGILKELSYLDEVEEGFEKYKFDRENEKVVKIMEG